MVVVASMTPSKAWDTLLADSQRYWSEDSEWRVAILAADARIKELEEAVGRMLKLYDENDCYNDTVADECRRAQAGR
jgi:hypothetical protein